MVSSQPLAAAMLVAGAFLLSAPQSQAQCRGGGQQRGGMSPNTLQSRSPMSGPQSNQSGTQTLFQQQQQNAMMAAWRQQMQQQLQQQQNAMLLQAAWNQQLQQQNAQFIQAAQQLQQQNGQGGVQKQNAQGGVQQNALVRAGQGAGR